MVEIIKNTEEDFKKDGVMIEYKTNDIYLSVFLSSRGYHYNAIIDKDNMVTFIFNMIPKKVIDYYYAYFNSIECVKALRAYKAISRKVAGLKFSNNAESNKINDNNNNPIINKENKTTKNMTFIDKLLGRKDDDKNS